MILNDVFGFCFIWLYLLTNFESGNFVSNLFQSLLVEQRNNLITFQRLNDLDFFNLFLNNENILWSFHVCSVAFIFTKLRLPFSLDLDIWSLLIERLIVCSIWLPLTEHCFWHNLQFVDYWSLGHAWIQLNSNN